VRVVLGRARNAADFELLVPRYLAARCVYARCGSLSLFLGGSDRPTRLPPALHIPRLCPGVTRPLPRPAAALLAGILWRRFQPVASRKPTSSVPQHRAQSLHFGLQHVHPGSGVHCRLAPAAGTRGSQRAACSAGRGPPQPLHPFCWARRRGVARLLDMSGPGRIGQRLGRRSWGINTLAGRPPNPCPDACKPLARGDGSSFQLTPPPALVILLSCASGSKPVGSAWPRVRFSAERAQRIAPRPPSLSFLRGGAVDHPAGLLILRLPSSASSRWWPSGQPFDSCPPSRALMCFPALLSAPG